MESYFLYHKKEVQEVQNDYKAYEEIGNYNPDSLEDLSEAYGYLAYLTVDFFGEFRKVEEDVFDGDKCIFMVPPADRVSKLMSGLFEWMNENKKTIHPLILSSIFHYEFAFIHPFNDGNGRTARLW